MLTLAACTATISSPADPLDDGQFPPAERVEDGGAMTAQGEEPIEKHGLSIEPATAVLVITERGTPADAQFRAYLGENGKTLEAVRWHVSGDLAAVDAEGTVTTHGITAGEVEVSATYGEERATAKVFVRVALREVNEDIAPDNLRVLQGSVAPDPGLTLRPPNPSKVLYPYDQTVMPRGLSAPTLQLSPGSLPPEDVRVYVSADGFGWDGFLHVTTPQTPRLSIPQDVWDAAMASAPGGAVTFEITKASAGSAYGPLTTHVIAADAALEGAVYYMTYDESALGLWSTRPGQREGPKQIVSGCTGCHSASANGLRLSVGAEAGEGSRASGVYRIGADGTASQITDAPNGLGGDSRGLSFATFTPDGDYVMRSQNDFWGGVNQRAFRVDEASKALVEARVVGLGSEVSAYLPTFAPDGSRYAFTNGAGENLPFGSVSRSLSIMDVSIDRAAGTAGTLTFTNRELLLDNGLDGSVVKFVNFLPDANLLLYQEGEGYAKGYGEMMPTWDDLSSFWSSTGRISLVDARSKTRRSLDRLNRGNVLSDAQRNYEPFALPVSAGGYFWVVFTSTREYGNTFQGRDVRKQLWVAAISTQVSASDDPSHPPFLLPNQGATRNERGFWALEPCRADGAGCETGDQCCGGSCGPKAKDSSAAGAVCGLSDDDVVCAELRERCGMTADCCGAASGTVCVEGYCDELDGPS